MENIIVSQTFYKNISFFQKQTFEKNLKIHLSADFEAMKNTRRVIFEEKNKKYNIPFFSVNQLQIPQSQFECGPFI